MNLRVDQVLSEAVVTLWLFTKISVESTKRGRFSGKCLVTSVIREGGDQLISRIIHQTMHDSLPVLEQVALHQTYIS